MKEDILNFTDHFRGSLKVQSKDITRASENYQNFVTFKKITPYPFLLRKILLVPKAYGLVPEEVEMLCHTNRPRVESPKGCTYMAAYGGTESRLRSWEVREGRTMTTMEGEGALLKDVGPSLV